MGFIRPKPGALVLSGNRNEKGEMSAIKIMSFSKSKGYNYGKIVSISCDDKGMVNYQYSTVNKILKTSISKLRALKDNYYEGIDGYYCRLSNDNDERFSNFIIKINYFINEINVVGNISKKINITVKQHSNEENIIVFISDYKNLLYILEKKFPQFTVFTDKIRNAKDRFKRILTILLEDQNIVSKDLYTFFGWGKKTDSEIRRFYHAGKESCISEKRLISENERNITEVKAHLTDIFHIASSETIFPLFLYQAVAYADALFTDAGYPVQYCLMAIAKTGSLKTHLFKILFNPFAPDTEKIFSVRSSAASLNILHEKSFDDVLVVDDFNVEGSIDETKAKKNKIWALIRAYSDKTPRAKYAGPNKIMQNAIRGGCVFTAEEELSGEILSSSVRYLKVFFKDIPNTEILSYFQVNNKIIPTFWSIFIEYLEKNYLLIVKKIKKEFVEMRIKYNKFSFKRLMDIGVHTVIVSEIVAEVLEEIGCFTIENKRVFVENVEETIFKMLEVQDLATIPMEPEIKFLMAIFDMISTGFIRIAIDVDQYVSNLSFFDGYMSDNIFMLKNVTIYSKVAEYWGKTNDYFGTSDRQIRKLLKEKNVIDHDSKGCLKRASDRIPGRPRMLAIKVDMAKKILNDTDGSN